MGPVGHRGRGSEVPLPVLQGETGKIEETGKLNCEDDEGVHRGS